MKLNRLELMHLIFGAVLSVVALFLFFYRSEQLGIWFGWITETRKSPIGILEYVKTGTKRKLYDSTEFLPAVSQQTLYDRDTLMTGNDSEAVISMYDGSVIHVSPGSLVQLTFKEKSSFLEAGSNVVVEVKKGSVQGKSVGDSLQIKQDEKTVVLPTIEAKVVEEKIEAPKRKDLNQYCHAGIEPTGASVDPRRGMKMRVTLKCDSIFEEKTHFMIRNAHDQVLFEDRAMSLQAGNAKQFELYFPKPGPYEVLWDEGISSAQHFTIDTTWSGIEFKKEGLYCDGTLRWEKRKLIDRLQLSDVEVDLINEQKRVPADSSSARLANVIQSYPAQVQIRAKDAESGFEWISPVITVNHAPACHELTYPESGAKTSMIHDSANLIFAWKQMDDHPNVRFEMSASPDFSERVIERETTRNFLRFKFSKKGTWYWRVVDQKTNEASDVYTIRVK